MTSHWREQHHKKHWTKSLDISFLYQLETIAAQMMRCAEKTTDKELSAWAGAIRFIVARVNGELANEDLSTHEMPEDTKAKIPDPRSTSIRAVFGDTQD